MKKSCLILLLLFLAAFTQVMAQENIVSGGITRNMIVYAPANLPANRPLLISMHGMNQDAAYQRNQANYEAVADTAKFVVVYPNGIDNGWDLYSDKDINFILDIITAMEKRYSIDRNRVYLSGFSMGGMMTYYAMTKIADKIAAFAPISGYNMGGPNAVSSRPIPIIHVHGTGDDVCKYPAVQSHIDAWVARNQCNPTAIVTDPYPKGTNHKAIMYRYTGGLNGVEVCHISMEGKGHWHSNDPACVMTNQEIWNFCKRWSLTPGPKLVSITPEAGSFDLSKESDNTFTVTFDKDIDASQVRATLTGPSSIVLTPTEKENGKTFTFTAPSYKLKDGLYTFSVLRVYGVDGSAASTIQSSYTFGYTEGKEEYEQKTVLTQDWYSQKPAIGEGIPYGWERVNTRSDATDKKTSGEANTGGARMKYFAEGGDFKAGFYLSARDYDKVNFSYGQTSGYSLVLAPGRYRISFRSTYWNTNAQSANNTFDMALLKQSDKSVIATIPGLKPLGCLDEKSETVAVKTSQLHEVDVTIPGNITYAYILQFSMAAGWNGIILSEPTITTLPTVVEECKGEFLRAQSAATKLNAKITSGTVEGHEAEIEQLRAAVEQYKDFSSKSPTEYATATKALQQAVKALEGVKIIVKGDADGDGEVTMADANLLVNIYLGVVSTAIDLRTMDMDGDGSITMADANAIVNLYLGN